MLSSDCSHIPTLRLAVVPNFSAQSAHFSKLPNENESSQWRSFNEECTETEINIINKRRMILNRSSKFSLIWFNSQSFIDTQPDIFAVSSFLPYQFPTLTMYLHPAVHFLLFVWVSGEAVQAKIPRPPSLRHLLPAGAITRRSFSSREAQSLRSVAPGLLAPSLRLRRSAEEPPFCHLHPPFYSFTVFTASSSCS